MKGRISYPLAGPCRSSGRTCRAPNVVAMHYPDDVLAAGAPKRRVVREVAAELDMVVETPDGGFCGAVVGFGKAVVAGEQRDTVTLADRNERRRDFPLLPA